MSRRGKSDPLSASQATGQHSGVDALLAGKRIEVLHEEGLISLEERLAWEVRIDRFEVSLDEVQTFFDRLRRKAFGPLVRTLSQEGGERSR
jgi:hypothetical protein